MDTQVNHDELIGDVIHELMWKGRVTQVALAAHLKIAQPTLARKLRGTRPWSVTELYSIAAFLGVPIDELLPKENAPRTDSSPNGGSIAAQQNPDKVIPYKVGSNECITTHRGRSRGPRSAKLLHRRAG